MVGIYQYMNGLRFTGKIAKDEETAWKYLDEKYGLVRYGVKLPCNHAAFEIKEVEEI